MAKKSAGQNKSAAIRDYYKSHPKAKPKEVLSALQASGIKTTTAFISTIRSNMKKGLGTGKRGRPAGSVTRRPSKAVTRGRRPAASSPSSEVSIDSLLKVKRVVEEMGSVDEARAALNALEKLLR